MRKGGERLERKTLLTLCQNRESPLKFTRIPLFIKAYSYFFKSKWGFSCNLVRDQANGPHIKSSTFNCSFNLETSKHDSRSSFIAPSDRNLEIESEEFIVLFHSKDSYRELYSHIYKYKLIICYTISWSCDLSFTRNCVYKFLARLVGPLCLSSLSSS